MRGVLIPAALFGLAVIVMLAASAQGDEAPTDAKAFEPSAARGYRHVLDTGYVPATLDEKVLAGIWMAWPEADRAAAEKADPAARRAMVFARYGFTPRPDDPKGAPLQLARAKNGDLHLSCFTCHAGQIDGRVMAGLPNVNIALQSLVEDARATRTALKLPLRAHDMAAGFIPHGGTTGTTNAVVFSIVLLQFRNQDLEVVPPKRRLHLPHHDLDAPPLWHYKRKTHLYMDGFAKPSHRALMQFLLVPMNNKAKVVGFENDYRDIQAWIQQVEAPKFPYEIDKALAAQGEKVFSASCAACHGTYGKDGRYPNRIIPLEKVGTDRARFDAIREEDRLVYSRSWLSEYDPQRVRLDTSGYVAPPLDGIWATAPYLHNGSVPTLHHLFFPDERPRFWKRDPKAYDKTRIGLKFETAEAMPTEGSRHDKRHWFDTTAKGKSNQGHDFPAKLSKPARRALLEYLKTL